MYKSRHNLAGKKWAKRARLIPYLLKKNSTESPSNRETGYDIQIVFWEG